MCSAPGTKAFLDDAWFQRKHLYSADELYQGFSDGGWEATTDGRMASWYSRDPVVSPEAAMDRAIHDANITIALDQFVADRSVVGVMGGHRLHRSSPEFAEIVDLGLGLADAGFTVATGGGPGAMEAANFGSWLGNVPRSRHQELRELVFDAPEFVDDRDAAIAAALHARELGTGADIAVENLGIPTWVYWHEPPNVFATAIAKYFSNSIREYGLLSIATAGIVFTKGGPGTWQEILTDAAQNSYVTAGERSPMVFLRYRDSDLHLVREQAREYGWLDLVFEVADIATAIAVLTRHQGAASTRRAAHRPQRERS